MKEGNFNTDSVTESFGPLVIIPSSSSGTLGFLCLEIEGDWVKEGARRAAEAEALPTAPESRTRLPHIPITVSLIGRWSTRKLSTGSWWDMDFNIKFN